MNKEKSAYFPLWIDLNIFPVLIIGGGQAAFRKAISFLEFTDNITVIASEICNELKELESNEQVKIIKRDYKKNDAKDFGIIISTVDNPEIRKLIIEDAQKYKLLLNISDNEKQNNFIMPGYIKRGDFVFALSTQGKAPFFAKRMKEEIEKILPPILSEITELASEFRVKLIKDSRFKHPLKRNRLYQKFFEIEWEKLFHEEGKEAAYKKMNILLK